MIKKRFLKKIIFGILFFHGFLFLHFSGINCYGKGDINKVNYSKNKIIALNIKKEEIIQNNEWIEKINEKEDEKIEVFSIVEKHKKIILNKIKYYLKENVEQDSQFNIIVNDLLKENINLTNKIKIEKNLKEIKKLEKRIMINNEIFYQKIEKFINPNKLNEYNIYIKGIRNRFRTTEEKREETLKKIKEMKNNIKNEKEKKIEKFHLKIEKFLDKFPDDKKEIILNLILKSFQNKIEEIKLNNSYKKEQKVLLLNKMEEVKDIFLLCKQRL